MPSINPQDVHFFSENLKYLLKIFGLNQSELAFFVSRKQTTISNWINGISYPDVSDLLKIHHYFGISMDALILMDIKNSKLAMDKYVTNFGNTHKDPMKGKFIAEEPGAENIAREPDPVFNRSVLGHLKLIDNKLDSLGAMTKKLLEKGGK
jgi:transcriptional regulator with XRE-family HTH domain